MYEEFEKHLSLAKLEEVTLLSRALVVNEEKAGFFFTNKFTLSIIIIIIAMINHTETPYSNNDYKRPETEEKEWQNFLQQISTAAEEIQIDQVSTTNTDNLLNNQVLKTIIQHLTRFEMLQTKALLNILTQADLK